MWRPYDGRLPSAYEFVAGCPRTDRTGRYTSTPASTRSCCRGWLSGRAFGEVPGREIWSRAGFEAPALLCGGPEGAPGSHGGLCTTLRDLARFGMLFTPSGQFVAVEEIISAEHVRWIQAGAWPGLHRDPRDATGYITAA